MAFYGTANTDFLCSKCFKEKKAEEKSNEPSAEVEKLVEDVKKAADAEAPVQLPE